jgi:hypothetical protein
MVQCADLHSHDQSTVHGDGIHPVAAPATEIDSVPSSKMDKGQEGQYFKMWHSLNFYLISNDNDFNSHVML